MKIDTARVLNRYAQVPRGGRWLVTLLAAALDRRWVEQPVAVIVVVASVFLLRAVPVRLSKYSYLTQSGIPAHRWGGHPVGPSPVVLALWARRARLGRSGCESPSGRASSTPAARCSASRRPSAPTRRCCASPAPRDSRSTSCRPLPSSSSSTSSPRRSLFYFTLLLRDKLEYAEKVLILRWEIISYLLTLIASVVAVAALQTLSPAGWVAVALALGVLGALTRQILEEAIGAEDLNKVHLMEAAIASNATLQGSFDQIERLAYRLLDWGDFRIYRVAGGEASLAYRGTLGRPDRGRPPGFDRHAPTRSRRARRARSWCGTCDAMIAWERFPASEARIVHPIRFGDELLGTVEVDHPKRHIYGAKDLAALGTLANQIATAIHIAELRRPLLSTVEQIGQQVTALAGVTESLRASAIALADASDGMRQGHDRAGDLRVRRDCGRPARSPRPRGRWPSRARRPPPPAAPRQRSPARTGS